MSEPRLRPGYALHPDAKAELAGLLMTHGKTDELELVSVEEAKRGFFKKRRTGWVARVRFQGREYWDYNPQPTPLAAVINALRDAEYGDPFLPEG